MSIILKFILLKLNNFRITRIVGFSLKLFVLMWLKCKFNYVRSVTSWILKRTMKSHHCQLTFRKVKSFRSRKIYPVIACGSAIARFIRIHQRILGLWQLGRSLAGQQWMNDYLSIREKHVHLHTAAVVRIQLFELIEIENEIAGRGGKRCILTSPVDWSISYFLSPAVVFLSRLWCACIQV